MCDEARETPVAERIWDRFLTERDRAHLAAAGPPPTHGFGERPAVLSIDNYRGAVGDHELPLLESIREWPGSTGLAGWRALERVEVLLSRARKAGVPVVHITGLPEEESGMHLWRRPRGNGDDEDRRRRRFEIVEQAAPVDGEVVLKKTSPSAFFGTPLMSHLHGEGIDTLIICGESTSGCVRATVVEARSYRFKVIVVEDAVYDRHESTHAMNLFDMNQKYADVLPLEDVLTQLDAGDVATVD
jgi:maleamate amidohydrolase